MGHVLNSKGGALASIVSEVTSQEQLLTLEDHLSCNVRSDNEPAEAVATSAERGIPGSGHGPDAEA